MKYCEYSPSTVSLISKAGKLKVENMAQANYKSYVYKKMLIWNVDAHAGILKNKSACFSAKLYLFVVFNSKLFVLANVKING